MMSILFPAAFLGLLVVLAVFFFQKREALDLSPRGLLRGYLYLASLAGIVTLAIGLGLYQALAAAILPANEFAYRQPADSLGGGIAALPIWLVYLRELVADFRDAPLTA